MIPVINQTIAKKKNFEQKYDAKTKKNTRLQQESVIFKDVGESVQPICMYEYQKQFPYLIMEMLNKFFQILQQLDVAKYHSSRIVKKEG